MAQQKRFLGGFVALNTGHITNCYSKISLRQRAHTCSGGFCGENQGLLDYCAAQGYVRGKGEKSGLCGRQKGLCPHSFWLRNSQMTPSDWLDWDLSISAEALSVQHLESWNLEEVWYLHSEKSPVRLSLYNHPPVPADGVRVVEIADLQSLFDFARQINEGESDSGTVYRLTADLDLGGRAWTPIGFDSNLPFSGCFDGGGHRICNFKILADKYPFAGFFGCVAKSGQVQNLQVDCVLLGQGSAAAPLCAHNEGEIVNCTASFHGEPSRYTGGFVAQNSGCVRNCAALGRIGQNPPIPWWAVACLLVALCIPLPVYFSLSAQAMGPEVYAPMILDPNAEPFAPEEAMIPEPEEEDDTSASFVMNTEMFLSTENPTGRIGLRCPSWSTRGFVATVRISQADLAQIGYSIEEDYLTLYQSGLIAPGYGVDVITLHPLPGNIALPAGTYTFSVLLEFYDMQTNEKSTVNTVVPLTVTVSQAAEQHQDTEEEVVP